jgi:hypothetical protein
VLRGFVEDARTGRGMPGASVVLLHPGPPPAAGDTLRVMRGTAVSGAGRYQFPAVQPGRYVVRVSFVGYVPAVDTLRLRGEAAVRDHDVALAPATGALPEARVTEPDEAVRLEAGRSMRAAARPRRTSCWWTGPPSTVRFTSWAAPLSKR